MPLAHNWALKNANNSNKKITKKRVSFSATLKELCSFFSTNETQCKIQQMKAAFIARTLNLLSGFITFLGFAKLSWIILHFSLINTEEICL